MQNRSLVASHFTYRTRPAFVEELRAAGFTSAQKQDIALYGYRGELPATIC